MTTIKRFNPDYKMHAARFEAFARETEHGEYVRFDAHQQVVSALEAERDAQQKRADALAASCSLYREAISKARRLINVDEMGDADDVLAQAERELSSHDAALAAIQARGVEKFAEFLDSPIDGQHCYQNEVGLARHFASALREAK